MTRVRSQGWAIVNQELEEGLRAIAAPIHGRDHKVVAAVIISTQANRTSLEMMRRELLPPLMSTVKRIEADLRIA